MKAKEVITLVDKLKPNKFTAEEKYRWLTEVDGLLVTELFETHEDSPLEGAFAGYSPVTDAETELLVPRPYDILYRWYLESQIDLANGELGKYNNSNALFNNAYLTFTDRWNRAHAPKGCGGFRFTAERRL